MEKKNTVRFYNVLFPVWVLFLLPVTWIWIIPGNFLIDSGVLLAVLWIFKVKEIKEFYKKTILWVFLFGFLADLIGCLFLLITQFMGGEGWLYEFIVKPVAMNPFDNIYAFLYTFTAVIISGIMIYIFNRYVSFRKCRDKKLSAKVALVLAIVTAPYLFLLPTSAVYSEYTFNSSNHIVWDEYINAELYIADDAENDILHVEKGEHFDYETVSYFRNAVNFAKKTKEENIGKLKYTVVFYSTGVENKYMDKIEIFERNKTLYFEWKDKTYEIQNDSAQLIYEQLNRITENIQDTEIK